MEIAVAASPAVECLVTSLQPTDPIAPIETHTLVEVRAGLDHVAPAGV
jgi:hypothetical protein